ncbi:MAG: hypothetical protein H6867_00490 [Rhodospirillales bacterium]|nr:hypothetical protein [Rhodospirillales bacterium]MCB9996864.1 hypothetical protein [Rhodospirillales bacterium]
MIKGDSISLKFGDLLRISQDGRYDYARLCDVFHDQVLVELFGDPGDLMIVHRDNIKKVKPHLTVN